MISVQKIHPLFGVEATGVRLQDRCDAETAAKIRALAHTYGVVVLRDQGLSPAALMSFSSLLGPVYEGARIAGYGRDGTDVIRIANIDDKGAILPADDPRRGVVTANLLWHTDSTFARPKAEISLLSAHIVPPDGGETEFCDTRVAYAALPEDRRKSLDGLFGYHSLAHSRSLTGFQEWTPEQLQRLQLIRRSLTHMHRETSRKALCIASHIALIDGFTPEQSQTTVNQLIDEATRPDLVYSHRWSVGDLVLWDNRCTMHRAMPYEDMKYARDMSSVRTVDQTDLEESLAA